MFPIVFKILRYYIPAYIKVVATLFYPQKRLQLISILNKYFIRRWSETPRSDANDDARELRLGNAACRYTGGH